MLKIKQIFIGFLLLTLLSVFGFAQKTPKVDFAKKIQEATPQELPQKPVAKKLKSDAQDNNLKGKVKSVIEYSQESGKKTREIYSEDYFNEDGNLIKNVTYDEGYPRNVTVWGYIDGHRVSKSSYITFTEKERPPSGRISITVSAEDNVKNPNAPKDTRYSIKHTYKYNEQGQLIEDWLYQNNGEVWMHTVYKFKGNQRVETNFDSNGDAMGESVEILDENGNVIERHSLDEKGKIIDKSIQTHEFDNEGNWIVEKSFEEKKVRGKIVRNLLWTSFRKITYYP